MDRVQELEIEVLRLSDEIASLKKKLAKIHGITASEIIYRQRGPGRGRPAGTTRINQQVFTRDLQTAYEALPADQRSRAEVAKALGISRRTLLRYCDRWDILWPPVPVATLEETLASLAAQQAAREARQGPPGHTNNQGGTHGNRRLSNA